MSTSSASARCGYMHHDVDCLQQQTTRNAGPSSRSSSQRSQPRNLPLSAENGVGVLPWVQRGSDPRSSSASAYPQHHDDAAAAQAENERQWMQYINQLVAFQCRSLTEALDTSQKRVEELHRQLERVQAERASMESQVTSQTLREKGPKASSRAISEAVATLASVVDQFTVRNVFVSELSGVTPADVARATLPLSRVEQHMCSESVQCDATITLSSSSAQLQLIPPLADSPVATIPLHSGVEFCLAVDTVLVPQGVVLATPTRAILMTTPDALPQSVEGGRAAAVAAMLREALGHVSLSVSGAVPLQQAVEADRKRKDYIAPQAAQSRPSLGAPKPADCSRKCAEAVMTEEEANRSPLSAHPKVKKAAKNPQDMSEAELIQAVNDMAAGAERVVTTKPSAPKRVVGSPAIAPYELYGSLRASLGSKELRRGPSPSGIQVVRRRKDGGDSPAGISPVEKAVAEDPEDRRLLLEQWTRIFKDASTKPNQKVSTAGKRPEKHENPTSSPPPISSVAAAILAVSPEPTSFYASMRATNNQPIAPYQPPASPGAPKERVQPMVVTSPRELALPSQHSSELPSTPPPLTLDRAAAALVGPTSTPPPVSQKVSRSPSSQSPSFTHENDELKSSTGDSQLNNIFAAAARPPSPPLKKKDASGNALGGGNSLGTAPQSTPPPMPPPPKKLPPPQKAAPSLQQATAAAAPAPSMEKKLPPPPPPQTKAVAPGPPTSQKIPPPPPPPPPMMKKFALPPQK